MSRKQFGFPKQVRLAGNAQFRRVFDHKLSVSDAVLVLYAVPNDVGRTRLGLAVSKKVGNAIVRNRWKRQIREAFRLHYSSLPAGIDLVALPRRGASPEHASVARSLQNLTARLSRKLDRIQGH